jgi:hypothetical protein
MKPAILNWLNETSLTPYPLVKSFGYDGFFIDAHFIQFDNFVPLLNYIRFFNSNVEISITFDTFTKVLLLSSEDYDTLNFVLRITEAGRYIGLLKFGQGLKKFVNEAGEQKKININTKFLSCLVRSIPSKAGVFTIDNNYGELSFLNDDYIYYEVDDKTVTFNAVYYPPIEDELYLKTLNSVGPTNNSVFIKNTDIIKVSSEPSTVILSLVGTNLKGLTKPSAIIVTNDGG